MLYIGSHVSFTKDEQLLGSLKESLGYGANTFMFYTGAPQNTNRLPINDDLTKEALSLMKDNDIDINKVIVHAPYIINLANPEEDKHSFSIRFLKEEVKRCEKLGISYMVLHPGSHVGSGVESGINNIVDGLNKILEDSKVMILLETMAGKGSEVGSNIDELKTIIDRVNNKSMIGLCLDTCHLNDAGYDISNFDSILDEIDSKIGIDRIKCIHINDSKNPISSHKDRHENIGYGYLGFDNIINIIYNPRLDDIPKILETPWIGEYPPYKEEIEMIRTKRFNNKLK